MRENQLRNSIIVKRNEIIAFGRLLEVEGKLLVYGQNQSEETRGKNHKELLIQKNKPLFSFQALDLVPYYLKEYNKTFPLTFVLLINFPSPTA